METNNMTSVCEEFSISDCFFRNETVVVWIPGIEIRLPVAGEADSDGGECD
jgi:hypothetical protein